PTRAGTLLPASKVTIPAPPEWMIARPRLIDLLAKGTRSALTVVVGPPGAGKTVAVAAWARSDRTPGPVAWVTLDPGDDRPDVFWPLLREGLERAGLAVPGAGATALEESVAGLAADLSSRDTPAVLVLDDLQAIRHASSVVDGLAYLAKH